tara:strand:- start:1446 stop:2168 length:723 start_codon:yes stop_codon:yes gene_type:complete
MINQNKWINSLPKTSVEANETSIQLDHDKWINTIPKKKTFNSVKKYSLMAALFVVGFLSVSAVKNETRNLQQEINKLKASINVIKFNLNQAVLDNEVITSPENISLLAKEYLDVDLISYKRSQIERLSDEEKIVKNNKIKKEKNNKEKIKNLSSELKLKVAKRIEEKKTEIKKLQEMYHNPETIPGEVKNKVAKQIKQKKFEIEKIYNSPQDVITLERLGRWSVVQVVKVFFGMPIIPGR